MGRTLKNLRYKKQRIPLPRPEDNQLKVY